MCKTSVIEMQRITLEAAEELSTSLSFTLLSVQVAVNKSCQVFPGAEWVAAVLRDGGYESDGSLLWRKSLRKIDG